AAPRLALTQRDGAAVIARPREPQEIALALPGVQGEDHCALHLDRRHRHEQRDMLGQPYYLASVGMIEPLEAAQMVRRDLLALDRPREHRREGRQPVVSLALAGRAG